MEAERHSDSGVSCKDESDVLAVDDSTCPLNDDVHDLGDDDGLPQQQEQLQHVTCSNADDKAVVEEVEVVQGHLQKVACVRHRDRTLVLYCCDCDTATCEMCFIERHNGHQYASIEHVAQRLRTQAEAAIGQIKQRVAGVSDQISTVDTFRTQLAANLQVVQASLAEAVDKVNSRVDAEVDALRRRLAADSEEVQGRLESAEGQLKDRLEALEAILSRCEESMKHHLIYDLPSLLGDVSTQLQQPHVDVQQFKPADFRFVESTYRKYFPDDRTSLIGQIEVCGVPEVVAADSDPTWEELRRRVNELETQVSHYSGESHDKATRLERELSRATMRETELMRQLQATEQKLKRTERHLIKPVRSESISGPRGSSSASSVGVRGLTLLDGHLYVLHVGRRSTDIGVYHVEPSTKSLAAAVRRFTIPALRDASDIAACPRQHCLYVPDVGADCVHRVYGLSGTLAFQFWPVGDKPWGLSVTSTGSLWVCCFVRQKLKEFTGFGQTLRVVSLHPDIGYPWHAVGLTDGRIMVCHGGVGSDGRRVVAVGVDGRGSTAYGLEKGAASTGGGGAVCGGGQSNSPAHIAVDADGFVVVVDCENRRLSILDPDLEFIRHLVTGKDLSGTKDPRRVCLDTENNRMYVGDGNGTVSIFELKT